MPCFPPRGPAGNRSPASRVLSRHCDFLPPLPPRFVAFAWRYHGCTDGSFLPGPRAVGRPGVVCPVSPAGNCRGSDRISQVPGEPRLSVCTWSSTPAGLLAPDQLQSSSVAPAMETTKAPTMKKTLSRLNDMASGLAVYASSSRLPIHDARLASGRWSSATGRAFHPQGSAERFQSCFLHLILLSQAFLAQFQNVSMLGHGYEYVGRAGLHLIAWRCRLQGVVRQQLTSRGSRGHATACTDAIAASGGYSKT
jgi:hypothetical protein